MKGERMQQAVAKAQPYLSLGACVGVAGLIVAIAVPSVRGILFTQARAAEANTAMAQRVSATETNIANLRARQDRLDEQMQHQIDRSNSQFQVVNDKLDKLLFMLANQRSRP